MTGTFVSAGRTPSWQSMRTIKRDEFYKDREHLRDNDSAFDQHKATKAFIKDLSLKHKVWVEWDLSQDSRDDRICILHIDDYKVVVDSEEVMRAVRFV